MLHYMQRDTLVLQKKIMITTQKRGVASQKWCLSLQVICLISLSVCRHPDLHPRGPCERWSVLPGCLLWRGWGVSGHLLHAAALHPLRRATSFACRWCFLPLLYSFLAFFSPTRNLFISRHLRVAICIPARFPAGISHEKTPEATPR